MRVAIQTNTRYPEQIPVTIKPKVFNLGFEIVKIDTDSRFQSLCL